VAIPHVRREALPWREALEKTECGRPNGGRETISRAQWRRVYIEYTELCQAWYRARRAEQPRPATWGRPPVPFPNICKTCWDTAVRWPTFAENPARALEREIDAGGYPGPEWDRLCLELMALDALRQDNPDRFAWLLRELPLEVLRRRGRGLP
jgi:hypothetical protein